MGARTGEQFLAGLRKTSRTVWLSDERVEDVTAHPSLAQAARTLADVFDRQHRYADECLTPDPETGEPINVSHIISRSVEDLERRNRGLARMSEATVGMMGRTPDYMNVKFACFAARRAIWAGADGPNAEGAENLVRFQRRLARQDILLTHTIIQPTVDKVTDPQIVGNRVMLHKVGETASGIVVRGARILATLAPFAAELRRRDPERRAALGRARPPRRRWRVVSRSPTAHADAVPPGDVVSPGRRGHRAHRQS